MAEPTYEGLGAAIDPERLAELGLGTAMDPAQAAAAQEIKQKQLSQYPVDPELTPERMEEMGELTDISRALEGRKPAVSAEMEAMGLAGVERAITGAGEKLSQAALNMTTADPMELADILSSRFPEDLEISISPDGVPVVTNKHNNEQFLINRPGFSAMDVLQTIGLIGTYSLAGKWAMKPLAAIKPGLKGEALKQARTQATRNVAGRAMLAEGATEYGLQKLQEMAGGKMDPGEVAFTALTAAVPEVVMQPVANLSRKAYNIVRDNVVIDEGIQAAIDFARKTGRKIATSDVLADTIKPPRKMFLMAAERIPLVGTGGMRLRQQKERADTLEYLFNEFGLSGDTEYSKYIANNFVKESAKAASESNRLRSVAFEGLKGSGNVTPRSMMNTVADELEYASKLQPDARRQLQNWLKSVEADFDGLESFTFKDADTFLASLKATTNKGGPKGEMVERVEEALAKDMKRHAKETGNMEAWNKWDLARNLGIKELKGIEDKALREALETGSITPDVVDRLLDTGRNKDINAFLRRTDATGKQLIRKRVLASALRKAGGELSDPSTVNLNTFVRVLDNDPSVTKGMAKYFTDEDRALLNGAKEYLRATSKSAKAFESIGMLAGGQAGGGGKRMLMGILSALLPPTQLVVAGARTHESNAVRDLLLRLNAAGGIDELTLKGPVAKRYGVDDPRAILAELRPLVIGLGQKTLTEGRDPFAPEVEPTMFERMLGGAGVYGQKATGAVGEFVEPAWDASMEYLRNVTGIGAEEEDASSP